MNSEHRENIYRYIKSMETEISVEHILSNNMSRSHSHGRYELYFLISGKRKLLIQNNFYKIEKGDILLISPGVLHKTLDETPAQYKRIVINFPQAIIDNVLKKTDTYSNFADKEAIIVRNPHIFDSVCDDILRLESFAKKENESLCEFDLLTASLLYKLICFLISGKNILPNTKMSEKNSNQISDILEYINKNYTRPLTITELSSRFYISEFYLCRSFKKYTGRTIVEYINYLRIEKAKSLLLKSKITIKEAAKISGFKTTTHFNHTFKEYEKINPSMFLKQRK